jgi:hypothetical protein
MLVECLIRYKDVTLGRAVTQGEIIEVSPQRAKELLAVKNRRGEPIVQEYVPLKSFDLTEPVKKAAEVEYEDGSTLKTPSKIGLQPELDAPKITTGSTPVKTEKKKPVRKRTTPVPSLKKA